MQLTISDSTISPLNPSLTDFNLSQINTSGNKSICTNGLRANEFVDMIKVDNLKSEKHFRLMRDILKKHNFYKSKSNFKFKEFNFNCRFKYY